MMTKLWTAFALVSAAALLSQGGCQSGVTVYAEGGQGPVGGSGAIGGSGAAGAGGTGAAGSCATPLDDDTLSMLSLLFFPGIIELQPGQSHAFEVGVVECCYFFEPVDACAEWSVEPADGASITDDGVLSIEPTAHNGSMFMVEADIEQGKALLTAEVWVYTEQDNPLVGTYHEIAQIDCQQPGEIEPAEPIGELRFLANSQYMLTWWPFEVYVDYWGPYSYDLQSGALTMVAESGNYVPSDMDGQGTFSFDAGGDLLLQDMYLGSPSAGPPPTPICGHRFR